VRVAVYHNLPFGGARRVMDEQIAGLGSDVAAVYTSCDDCVADRVFPINNVGYLRSPFGRLNGLLGLINLGRAKRAGREIAREIDALGCDVAFVHPCRFTQAPTVLAYLKTPAVYYCHEPHVVLHDAIHKGGAFFPRRDPLRAAAARAAIASEECSLRATRVVLSNSRYIRESLIRIYGVDSVVNYPGVDVTRFRPVGEPREKRVIIVGSLSWVKGHDFVVDSLARIDAAHRPVLCVVTGDRSEESKRRIIDLAASRGVKVEFQESPTDEQLAALYSTSIATVCAAILEPLGLTPLESAACATPVVAVAEAGLRETTRHEVTGLLTDRDPEAFADSIRRLVDSPEMVEEMGRAGRAWVESEWTWERSLGTLRAALARAAGGTQ